jgi:hypothetical protein
VIFTRLCVGAAAITRAFGKSKRVKHAKATINAKAKMGLLTSVPPIPSI